MSNTDPGVVPTVIVATEHESMVRLYVGHPENGGMDQTGQFHISRTIEPTALANMAVDLASSLGWLDPAPTIVEVGNVRVLPNAHPHALPPTKEERAGDVRSNQWVHCPVPGCDDRPYRRKNMARHLMGSAHGWASDKANEGARNARAAEAPTEPQPRGKHKAPATPPPNQAPSRRIHDAPARTQHGLTRSGRINRQGPHGAAMLERDVFPNVIKLVRKRKVVTSTIVAEAFGTQTSTTLAWLVRLTERGELVESEKGSNGARTFTLPDATTPPPITSGLPDDQSASTIPLDATVASEERNPTNEHD